jgi:hypothetical protein
VEHFYLEGASWPAARRRRHGCGDIFVGIRLKFSTRLLMPLGSSDERCALRSAAGVWAGFGGKESQGNKVSRILCDCLMANDACADAI